MPYGERHENSSLATSGNPFLYNGKESQKSFGVNYIDSEARFQRLDGAFNSIDPLCEENYWVSPYSYCAGNPIKYIDENGKLFDDYFNYAGKYLGSDGTTSANIRIVSDDIWQEYATDQLSILTNVFTRSVLFSQALITYEAAFNVIEHYNYTNVTAIINNGTGRFDMRSNIEYFEYEDDNGNVVGADVKGIKLEVNSNYMKNSGLYDNFYNIISSFEHENKHITDAKTSPFVNIKRSISEKELRAIEFQRISPTYIKTTSRYKEKVNKYEQNFY